MFVPDYSQYDKLLVPNGDQHLNDLNLARHAKSQELSEMFMGNNAKVTSNDAPAIVDYDNIPDDVMFDCCIDKSLQSPEEFQNVFKEFRL